ncbi:MAG: glycosyltransferase family 2 protein [Cyclobacteriaceae bacterium]
MNVKSGGSDPLKSRNQKVYISVVIPVYESEGFLVELVERLEAVLQTISTDFEIILVDDRSRDGSWEKIEQLSKGKNYIKGIRLSRNFGQHRAITAGLQTVGGEWAVVMDADLQDAPESIPLLLTKARYGYDVVLARRIGRRDAWWIRMYSKWFYGAMTYMTGIYHDPAVGNFGIYHKHVIEQVLAMREHVRYFPSMVRWVGFHQTTFDVPHSKSKGIKSNYDFRKRFQLGLMALIAFSDKPLRLTIKVGIMVSSLGFLFALVTLFRYVNGSILVPGYASLIVSIWVLSGMILMTLGLVGLYVGKIFEGVKNRPLFIVDKTT